MQLFEFLDLPRLPRVLRTLATEYLQASQQIGGGRRVADLVASRVESLLAGRKTREIVDLCSGSGGLTPAVARRLGELGAPVHVTLTDLFPDPDSTARLTAREREWVRVHPEPVDARAVPPVLAGARTIFIGFHHFPPDAARAILADAVRAGEPVLVLEGTERRLAALLPFALASPLWVLLLTPFIRPLRSARLFFTYLVPLVPLIVWWDGIVSHLRSYSCAELLVLARGLGAGWRWDARRERIPGTPIYATSLIGLPPGRQEVPMAAIRSAAPQLLVKDLRRSLDFYEQRLGFGVDFVYEGFYAAVSRGGAVIHLKCADKIEAEREHRRAHDHLDAFLDVSGVRELFDELKARGAPLATGLERRPWNAVDFRVVDPDGYVLCFSAGEP